MLHPVLRARCALVFMACIAIFINSAAAQKTGAITGHVSNAGTGAFLQGAEIRLEPSGHSTLTTREGRFSFSQVPAGQHQLSASYTGLDTQTVAVNVQSGSTVNQEIELTSQIYQLEKFVVPGEREGNALAVTMQRIAPNIKNVLSADAFGNIADQNLGNFLLRLPGIGTEKSEGEIYRVQVRGVNADLNAVTIDGTRAASGSTRGLSRGFEIDKVPADFIELIEVTKAPTPDMDADSIGGAINLKTKSAFDRRERMIAYTAGTSFNPDRESFVPLGTFMYSNIVGADDRIGLLLTSSYSESHKPRDSSNVAWERTTATNRPVWFHQTDRGEDELKHTRAGLGLRVDYKLSETATIYFNTMYSFYDDRLERRRGGVTNVSTSSPSANVVPGWTDTVTNTVNHRFRLTQNIRDRDITTYNFQVGGEMRWGEATLDWNANLSPSEGTEHRNIFSSEVRGVGFTHRRDRGGKVIHLTQTGGPDIFAPESYSFIPLEQRDFVNNDEIMGAQVNFRKPFETRLPTYLKTGLRMRSQERKQDTDRAVYNYVGNKRMSFYDSGYKYSSYDGLYPAMPFLDVPKIASAIRSNPGDFALNVASSVENSTVDDGEASEEVYAGYLMAGIDLGKLNILTGVRIEETRLDATGYVEELTPAERARRASFSGPLTEAEIRRRTLAEFGNLRSASGQYRDVFPGIHLRYELRPGLVARASWSTGIGRPNFDTLLPNASIDHEDQEIDANNTDLRPQYSDNYDVALEYYFEPSGLLSVGVFRKEITDFIFNDDAGVLGPGNRFGEQYVGYALRTDFNGGSATIKGFEFAYQQQFSFLPGFWKGFGAFANYTWLESEGNYSGPGTVVTNAELENFVPRTANAGISYIGHNLTVRVQMNYTDVHLDSYNNDASRRQYVIDNKPVDLNLRYDFSPRLGVFVDVINVFNEPTNHEYTFAKNRRSRNDLYTTMWKMGISGRF
ncbi:MAG: TonB-dependent receptor [Verrucomicrobia bacterium]|nr:TonB-dependent receptor [Verrucomicrobiota bacterium]